jgi:sulfane dehydrogenase subunit SoxC
VELTPELPQDDNHAAAGLYSPPVTQRSVMREDPEREQEPAGEPTDPAAKPRLTRRDAIAAAAVTAGGAVLASVPLAGQSRALQTAAPAPAATPDSVTIPTDPTRAPGPPTSPLGVRSPFETPARTPIGAISGSSMTPLHKLTGTVTPSDLVFERHHAGVAIIDPARYRLMIHGMVDRPTVFTLDDLRRLPNISRTVFLECSGNGRGAFRTPKRDMTPQQIDGMTSNGEWTGVALTTLFREVGVRRGASWLRAEGGDAARLSRSIPLAKGLDDAMIAYAFNGEPLRPANGYPARLMLPGYEGNTCVKWVRRIEVTDAPGMFRDETSKYTDPLANGTARQFSFVMDAKSIITEPAFPSRLTAPGWVQISGLAWSGRGRVERVDVTVDGGRSWMLAELQEPVLPVAHTRFRLMWQWDGKAATIASRATDETGYVQPTLAEFRDKRGAGTDYHFNYVRGWLIGADGTVSFAVEG